MPPSTRTRPALCTSPPTTARSFVENFTPGPPNNWGHPLLAFEPPGLDSPKAGRDESNKRVSNARMKAELGVTLAYPDITSGVPATFRAEAPP